MAITLREKQLLTLSILQQKILFLNQFLKVIMFSLRNNRNSNFTEILFRE